MMFTRFSRIKISLSLCALLLSTAVMGQDGPIRIKADRAELSEKEGESYYIGNVRLTRGEVTMTGDRLRVRRDPDSAEIDATLFGPPASIRQPGKNGETIIANARRIDYVSQHEMLILKGNANIVRGTESFKGNEIRYYTKTQRIISEPKKGGVEVVIQPQNKQDQQTTP